MIGSLRKKFVATAMLAFILVTLMIFGIILVNNRIQMNSQLDGLLNFIISNDGDIPEYNSTQASENFLLYAETKFSTRYFYVKFDNDKKIIETYMEKIVSVNESDAQKLAKMAMDSNKHSAYDDNFRYMVSKKDYGYLVVFLDATKEIKNFDNSTLKAQAIIIIGWIITLIITSVLSEKALGPIAENIEKQKKFVANAGHDLKTPVAVILADCEVLEMTMTEDKEWLQSIENQAKRLDKLVKNLLRLANYDVKKTKLQMTNFSITKDIKDEIEEFKALSKDRKIDFDDSNDIIMHANEDSIKQVLTILFDNAIKYTEDDGHIIIKAYKQGRQTRVDISNPYNGSDEDKQKIGKLFERFYRGDPSRNNSKEGYGIGLSMAKSIIESNRGKISVSIDDKNYICFSIVV